MQDKLTKQLGALRRHHVQLKAIERADPHQWAQLRDDHHLMPSRRAQNLKEWEAHYAKEKATNLARKRNEIFDLQRIIGNRVLAGLIGLDVLFRGERNERDCPLVVEWPGGEKGIAEPEWLTEVLP